MDAALALSPPAAVSTAVLAAGTIVAALLAGVVVIGPPRPRLRAGAALAALTLTPALLVASIAGSDQFDALLDRPGLAALAAALGALFVAALAVVLDRRPAVLPIAAVAALPFRVPVSVGGDTANLLVPLYLVIGAAVLAYAVPRLFGRERPPERPAGALEWVLVAVVVLYAAQAAYSSDADRALQQVVFFYVPFALLFALLARVRWTRRVVLSALGVLVGLALVFVAVGAVEYATRQVLLNPRIIASNQFEEYFRVNSLFFDPNIYGRFLVMVMLALAAVLLWSTRRRAAVLAALALAVLWGGLVLTLSQSSFVSLLAGLTVLGALRWGAWRAGAAAAGVVAVGAAFVALAPGAIGLDLGDQRSAERATSGRYDLVAGGVELFSDRPLAGYGSGAFRREYRRQEKASSERAAAASHTIPITVAAEQGVGGLGLYLLLLALAFHALFGRASASPARAAVAAAFAALVVHTLLYAAFLEDPLAWTLLGAGVAFTRRDPLST